MTGVETLITLERGDTTSDVRAFARCGRTPLPMLYRKWTVRAETATEAVTMEYVVPDAHARYIAPYEVTNSISEFLQAPGQFTAQYWDFAIRREDSVAWLPQTQFVTAGNYDGNGRDFGIRVVTVNGHNRIEFSNEPGNTYFVRNTQFSY